METPARITRSDPRFAERYRAMSSRDARFDGQFIAGVHSTGIYCRPSCPAMTPKPGNVSFYRTAAAAHEAGLRACKRCLPDAVPESPEWNIRDDVACRAMRLIADGVVNRDGVSGLAHRLGYTPRHLGRVLVNELGAGPLALARAHRAQTARTLLVSTDLPIADVAFAAGFSSVRQFNETVQAVYELTPTALRLGAPPITPPPDTLATTPPPGTLAITPPLGTLATTQPPGTDGSVAQISLRLPTRGPFDGAGLLAFFAAHAIAGVETADARSFARFLRLPRGIGHIEIRLDGADAVLCTAGLENIADLSTLVSRVRRLLDLDADSAAIDESLIADPVLAQLNRERPGLRIPGSLDAAETLFRTMIGQQISVASARTVLGRLCGELSATPGLFPTAVEIAEHGAEFLRGPASRIASILGAARALADGSLRLDLGMPSDEFTTRLTALPGIGPWTAGYLAMRVLGNPDVLLASDLVLLASAARLGLPATASTLTVHSLRWAPWRSYAGVHLWGAAGR
ncbi:AlkA N-terminal domain-containing protein [Frigoribacterium sp. CG_9.8]|uniref:AlkA N-terminal domain-containing protein n=1 Tax=Frigoribacterium sp. CG_9.8 TaxID=2787733 RepID=UPI0018C8F5D4|nr:AlkA N-terminal domain-containing protein [Frigoribacterium sp. CG_9.8]